MKQTPNYRTQVILSVICGIVTFMIDFYLIPRFMMRGISDAVWAILMILLPTVAAAVLLGFIWRCKPACIFWGLPVQLLIAAVLCKPVGDMLGFHLESFGWDFFDFIAYGLYIIGWTLGATVAQFLVLWCISKFSKK